VAKNLVAILLASPSLKRACLESATEGKRQEPGHLGVKLVHGVKV
jgi:hypothetical protein